MMNKKEGWTERGEGVYGLWLWEELTRQ